MRRINTNRNIQLTDVLKRSKTIHRIRKWDKEMDDRHNIFLEEKNKLKKRPPRVLLLQDNGICSRLLLTVLKQYHPQSHVSVCENITQAMVELEIMEYDMIALDMHQQRVFPELFVEVIQQQHEYLHVFLLNQSDSSELPELTSKFHLVEPSIRKRDVSRMIKNVFKSHAIMRQRLLHRNYSSIDQKLKRLKHSA